MLINGANDGLCQGNQGTIVSVRGSVVDAFFQSRLPDV